MACSSIHLSSAQLSAAQFRSAPLRFAPLCFSQLSSLPAQLSAHAQLSAPHQGLSLRDDSTSGVQPRVSDATRGVFVPKTSTHPSSSVNAHTVRVRPHQHTLSRTWANCEKPARFLLQHGSPHAASCGVRHLPGSWFAAALHNGSALVSLDRRVVSERGRQRATDPSECSKSGAET